MVMNAFWGIGLASGMIYGVFCDGRFWKIYFALSILYFIWVQAKINKKDNGKRKTLMIATWNEPSDPTSYMVQDIKVSKAKEYLAKLNAEQSEIKYTMTHLVGYAMALGLHKIRRDVGRIVWGYFKHAKKLGITVLVDIEGGKDLVPVTIWDAHKMTLKEFTLKCTEKVMRAKNKKDKAHNQSTALAQSVPSFIIQPLMTIATYLSVSAGVEIPALGLRENFGHVILTNIGSIGYQQGYAPLCTPMRSMGLFCIGAVEKKPVVENDEIIIRDMMNLVMTADHRYGDAALFRPLYKCFGNYIADPTNYKDDEQKENAHWSEKKEA